MFEQRLKRYRVRAHTREVIHYEKVIKAHSEEEAREFAYDDEWSIEDGWDILYDLAVDEQRIDSIVEEGLDNDQQNEEALYRIAELMFGRETGYNTTGYDPLKEIADVLRKAGFTRTGPDVNNEQ
jgi:hypothetical protein